MQQPVSFCTACLFAPTRFANPSVLRFTEHPCVVSDCAVTRTVMTHRNDYETRQDGAVPQPQIVFTLDLAGNFKTVNDAAQDVFGYTAAEMRLMNIAELIAPDLANYLQDQIARAVVGDLGAVYEVEIYAKNGQSVPLELSTQVVMRNGCPFELAGIACPRTIIWEERPRCLDEEFWIGPGLNGPSALTFLPIR
jgi:PAS domain S-box-containing protein